LKGGGISLQILSRVRPEVDLAGARSEYTPPFIVVPIPAGAVAGGIEPALVASHDETIIRRIPLFLGKNPKKQRKKKNSS
jgi:hypothetical protein